MKDFEQILADSLDELAGGRSLEECLARHPEHARELRPLLETAARMERGARNVHPSPVYKARTRAQVLAHAQANPRNNGSAPFFLRLTVGLAALLLAFTVTGTAFAQGAMPGDPLYAWKRSSERAWRAVSPDPLGTDLELSRRRALEWSSVSQDPDRSTRAAQDYQESLDRLQSRQGTDTQGRIYPFLKNQQEMFKSSGLSVPQLDDFLSGISGSTSGEQASPQSLPEQQPLLPATDAPILPSPKPASPGDVVSPVIPELPALPVPTVGISLP